MASYAELLTASADEALVKKIRVACVVAAEIVRLENPATQNHTNRLAWAKSVFESPETVAQRMTWAVLAQNRTATLAEILSATDSTVQTAVNAAVDVFAQ